jgi:hypothetical protein
MKKLFLCFILSMMVAELTSAQTSNPQGGNTTNTSAKKYEFMEIAVFDLDNECFVNDKNGLVEKIELEKIWGVSGLKYDEYTNSRKILFGLLEKYQNQGWEVFFISTLGEISAYQRTTYTLRK